MSPPKKLCFVVGPIGRVGTPERIHADWLNEGIIKPLFKEHFESFSTVRADEISVPGMIDAQVINHLFDAELVISDMSFRNANAFYEMGIRHAVQKPIIHMYKSGEEIPFDVQPYRAIEFALTHPSDLVRAKEALRVAIERALDAAYKPDNPVIRARGFAELEKTATPPEKALLDRLSLIETRLSSLATKSTRAPRRAPKNYDQIFWIYGTEKITSEQFNEFVNVALDFMSPKSIQLSQSDGTIEIELDVEKKEAIMSLLNHTMPEKLPWFKEASDSIPF
ncbi:hypothetical protein [Pseudolabrys sp. FHR47]|uniref:hypothetical protein n=1 Tax=Pseudolabrys sp. FHR47 TaxID=2562284 RepID=UPI0010BE4D42|nr:hypothetical protein [Pseudolabrys sp. FHR47]